MKKKIIKTLSLSLAILLSIILFIEPLYANEWGRGKKLVRGIVNVVTGWVEIPKQIYEVSVETNPLVGITYGPVKGLGMCIVRMGTGAFDTVTFIFPTESLVKPEFVFNER